MGKLKFLIYNIYTAKIHVVLLKIGGVIKCQYHVYV